jgi:RNA recognition motif-containing protein
VVESVRIKYDSSGRSLGQAELLFKTVESAKDYQSRFNGETLDGMALSIELLRPYNTKKPQVQEKGGVFDRLGSSVGKKQGGKSLDDRLGKRIQDRLGKSLDERLGALPQGNSLNPKKNKKKKTNERRVKDYGDTEVAVNDGEMILG